MAIIGEASLDVKISVASATATLGQLRKAVAETFRDIGSMISESFEIDKALIDLKVLTSTLGELDSLISSIESKDIQLARPYQEALDVVKQLRAETLAVSGVGVSKASIAEERQLQEALFLAQTEGAHQAALAKERAYEETLAVAKKAVGEERALQEALFLLQTQGAHEAALAKEKAFQESVSREPIDLGVRNVSQEAAEATRSLKVLQQQVENLRKAAAQGLIEPGTATREIQQTNNAIRALGGETRRLSLNVRSTTQEQLANAKTVQELRQQYNLLGKQLGDTGARFAAQNKLAVQAGAIGADITKTTGTLQKSGGMFGFVKDAGAKANSVLERFGLSMRDINVIAGAGFLSTAGPALVVMFGVKIVQAIGKAIAALAKFSLESAKQASALEDVQDEVGDIFGDSATSIENFATRSALAFGTTEQAALSFAAKAGRFFESVGIGAEASAELTEGLLGAGEVLRRTTGEFVSSERALAALNNLVGGNIEGLRELGIRLTESGLRAVGLRHGLNITNDTLDDTQRGLLSTIAALEAARDRFDDARSSPETLAEAFERFKAIITVIVTEIGKELLPIFEFLSKAAIGLALSVYGVIKRFQQIPKEFPAVIKAFKGLLKLWLALNPTIALLVKALELMGKRAEGFEDLAFDEIFEDISEGIDKAVESYANLKRELTPEDIQSVIDAHIRLNRAIQDFERDTAQAELNLARAREDAAHRSEEAHQRLADTYEDQRNRIADAQRKIEEAEVQNARALFDAQERLDDAKLQGARKIRDAEERLSDARIDAARKTDDAERRLAEARRKRLDDIFKAQLSLEEALARGDVFAERRARLELKRAQDNSALKEAQRNFEQVREDQIRNLKRLERDLEETRLDVLDNIRDAERELARTVEDNTKRMADAKRDLARVIAETNRRIREAQENLARTEIENNRRLYDSRQALEEAIRRGREAILDAGQAVDKLNEKFGTTNLTLADLLDKLERMKTALQQISNIDIINDGTNATGIVEFQHGGHIRARQVGIVGEAGPELFIPNTNGTIVSNDQLVRVLNELARSNGSSRGHQFIVQETVDPRTTAEAIAARLAMELNA